MDLLRFFAELKRRRVVRVAVVYMVAAFAVLQAADIIFPALGLPAWTVTLVVVLSFLGFPVALALAWAFDLTPGGVVRTGNAPWEVEGRRSERPHGLPRKALPYLGIGILVGLVSDGAYSGIRTGAVESGDSSVAVLPFASLTAGEDNAYLASGIHNEILTQLSKMEGLKVIARSSVLQYAGGATHSP